MASSTRRLTTSRSGRNAYQARKATTAAIGITSFHFFISASPLFLLLLLDAESEFAKHSYSAGLSTLEVTRTKLLPRGELISCAQDCLWRVTAFSADQLIGRGRSETMLREELVWAQPVVLVYRAQHVMTGHAIPCHHVFSSPFAMRASDRKELLDENCGVIRVLLGEEVSTLHRLPLGAWC